MTHDLDIGRSALLTDLALCINTYRLHTPGLYVCTLAPVQFDDQTLLVPGVVAMVNHGALKQCEPNYDTGAFHGPPNFVLDVFPSNDLLDYDSRRESFERAGVIEYVAVQDTPEPQFIWNRRVDGGFIRIEEDDSGTIRSTALPGLWIPVDALKNRDWWSILAAIARGVTRKPHHEFMSTIWR